MKRNETLYLEHVSLTVEIAGYAEEGAGVLSARDSHLGYSDDPSGAGRWLRVPRDELITLRDFLNHLFPAESAAAKPPVEKV